MRAKDLVVKPITSAAARAVVERHHYSGKVDPRSTLHFGVFVGDRLEGAMQFGSPIDKRKMLPLVSGTKWHDMMELNRMAFGPALPRNSESRALAVAFRLIRNTYPNIEWVVSFADGTQCGDGAIYRASGFILTAIKRSSSLWRMPSGEVVADIVSRMKGSGGVRARIGFRVGESWSTFARRVGAEKLPGFQLRYVYFLNPAARARLTVPVLPFSAIDQAGARMYLGEARPSQRTSGDQPESGGVAPTRTLHTLNPEGV